RKVGRQALLLRESVGSKRLGLRAGQYRCGDVARRRRHQRRAHRLRRSCLHAMVLARRGSGGDRQEPLRRERRNTRPAGEPGRQALELQSLQSAADGKPGAARDESLTRMDLATYKTDVWGREVILGASWDL